MIFMKQLLVGFSRDRDFECFMSHEVMKENTKVVTELPAESWSYETLSLSLLREVLLLQCFHLMYMPWSYGATSLTFQ